MKAYQDKLTGKWKWGTRGNPIHESRNEAERWGLDQLTDRLRQVRDKLDGVIRNHGRL